MRMAFRASAKHPSAAFLNLSEPSRTLHSAKPRGSPPRTNSPSVPQPSHRRAFHPPKSVTWIHPHSRVTRVSFLCALGQTFLFGVDRATSGVAKLAGQYVAEFTANLAFHLISLTAIVCGNHDVQQIVSPFGDGRSNHFQYLGVKKHHSRLNEAAPPRAPFPRPTPIWVSTKPPRQGASSKIRDVNFSASVHVCRSLHAAGFEMDHSQHLDRKRTPRRSLLSRSSVRHHSEIVFGVLVVVLRRDPIAGAGFSLGQCQIPLIVSLRVVRALRLCTDGTRCPPL